MRRWHAGKQYLTISFLFYTLLHHHSVLQSWNKKHIIPKWTCSVNKLRSDRAEDWTTPQQVLHQLHPQGPIHCSPNLQKLSLLLKSTSKNLSSCFHRPTWDTKGWTIHQNTALLVFQSVHLVKADLMLHMWNLRRAELQHHRWKPPQRVDKNSPSEPAFSLTLKWKPSALSEHTCGLDSKENHSLNLPQHLQTLRWVSVSMCKEQRWAD